MERGAGKLLSADGDPGSSKPLQLLEPKDRAPSHAQLGTLPRSSMLQEKQFLSRELSRPAQWTVPNGHFCPQHKWGIAAIPTSNLSCPWMVQSGFQSVVFLLGCSVRLFLKGSIRHKATTVLCALRSRFPAISVHLTMGNRHIDAVALPRLMLLTVRCAPGYHISEKLPEASVGRLTLGEKGSPWAYTCRPFFPDPVAPVLSSHPLCGCPGLPEPEPCSSEGPFSRCHT